MTEIKKEDLQKLTVKELRVMVVKLGMAEDAAEVFETKKPLIATITTLRANASAPSVSRGQLKKDKKQYLSKKETMRALLMDQPRIRILIPTQGKEKPGDVRWIHNKISKRKEQVLISGAYTPVQLNGFKWIVPHGIYVEVPQQIADVISDSQNMTNLAGKSHLIDRVDPKTGKPMADKLSY